MRLALPLLVAAMLVPLAHGAEPDGAIAYMRYRFVNKPLRSEIWVTNADGAGARKLEAVGPNVVDEQPDWSPDGTSIAFDRCPDAGQGVCGIYAIRADGSGLTRLTPRCPPHGSLPRCVDDVSPAYSPDGRHLALVRASGPMRFGRPRAIELMVGDLRLRHLRRVAWSGPYRGVPSGAAWSPDGTRLAFTNDLGTNGRTRSALYVVNAGGGGLRRVTPFALQATDDPDWSPDGSAILFRGGPGRDIEPGGGNLYSIRSDGAGLRQLTHFPNTLGVVHSGSFSPDGQSIVFATSYGATRRWATQHPDLFVMRADGTDMRPVTRTINWDDAPDWGPG
jgi:TolB protein